MYATIQLRGEVSPTGESIDGKPNFRSQTALVPAFVTLTWIALSGLTVHAASRENLNPTHLPATAALPECSHLSGWTHEASPGQHCLTGVLIETKPIESADTLRLGTMDFEIIQRASSPLFGGLGMVGSALDQPAQQAQQAHDRTASKPHLPEWSIAAPRQGPTLSEPVPGIPAPWVFEGNGGMGVKTWLSESHVLEINPHWLDFAMFDSMNMSMTDEAPGPGQSEPEEWRSAFTVGMATDWEIAGNMVLHAGYRFYGNPIPEDIASGAFPNANQHVIACGLSRVQGRHSVSLIYGLDIMDSPANTRISSARQGDNIDSMAHLVSLNYAFSF